MSRNYLHSLYSVLFNRHRIPFLLALIAVFSFFVILQRDASPPSMVQRPAIRVQVVKVSPSTERVKVTGYGSVEPSKNLIVLSEVSGRAIQLHTQFEEGGRLESGEALVQIDPTDYQIALEASKADVEHAQNDLSLENGNQEVAQYEYELFKKDMREEGKFDELVLRKPQLRDKQVALKVAKNNLKKAQIDLDRATIKVPFSSLVIKKAVTIGAYISQGSEVAEVVSVDKFYVKVRVPGESLDWILFDTNTGLISPENKVQIFHQRKDGTECVREGAAERVLSNVEGAGRMVQILTSLSNPLMPTDSCPPFLLGSFVRVEIEGKILENILKIPRKAVREKNRIYVADSESRLRVKTPEFVHESEDFVWFRGQLADGDRVILSDITTPLEGMKLEIGLESVP